MIEYCSPISQESSEGTEEVCWSCKKKWNEHPELICPLKGLKVIESS